MFTAKFIYAFIEALSFSITALFVLDKHVIFRFNRIICLLVFGITTFIAYFLHSIDIFKNLPISFVVASFEFFFLVFYVVTIKEKIYHALLAIMAQVAAHSILYSLLGLISSHFFPSVSPNQLETFNQLLPYIPIEIIYIISFIFIYKKSDWFHNLIFSIPLTLLFLPYQTMSYLANNYTGKLNSTELYKTTPTIFSILLLFAIISFIYLLISFYFSNKNALNALLQAKEKSLTLQIKHISKLDYAMKSASKIRHDLNNYLLLFKNLNESGQKEKSIRYQDSLVTSCDTLINSFKDIPNDSLEPIPSAKNSINKKLNAFFNVIDNSNLISAGLFILHYYCTDIIFKHDNFFVIPSYVLLLLTILVFSFRKKTSKKEVCILIGIFLCSVSIFALQVNFDSMFFATLTMVLFFYVLLIHNYNKFNTSLKIGLIMIFIFLSISFTIITTKYNDLLYTLAFLGMFCLIISISIVLQNQILKKKISKKKSDFEEYKTLTEESENFATMFLHIKNSLLNFDHTQQNATYILDEYDHYFSQYKTGNSVINAIISSKYQRCLQLQINLITSIFFPSNMMKDELTFGRLLFNLLDNAIEASEKSPISSRKINLSIKAQANFLFITIENSKEISSTPIASKMKTSKKKGSHGLGLIIIKDIIDSYNGTLEMKDFGTTFLSKIILDVSST